MNPTISSKIRAIPVDKATAAFETTPQKAKNWAVNLLPVFKNSKSIISAWIELGIAKSALNAKPLKIQITTNNVKSPSSKKRTNINIKQAYIIAQHQTLCLSYLLLKKTHKGTPIKAPKKYKNNKKPVNSGLFNIEFTKNTNKAGGSPLARPLIK